jgi:hypothetical protein
VIGRGERHLKISIGTDGQVVRGGVYITRPANGFLGKDATGGKELVRGRWIQVIVVSEVFADKEFHISRGRVCSQRKGDGINA